MATQRRSRSCERPGRAPFFVRRRAPRAGSAPRCACCPKSAPPEERVDLLLARAEALGATGRLEESRTDLLESIGLVPDELVAVRVS